MQQKILLLGGSHGQLPAIREAKKRGMYTILCDYLPDNPGKEIVDKFYLVSTTDTEAVLDLAMKQNIDYVLGYASDPAAITQATVSKKLNIPGSSVESVRLLSRKHLFRKFQQRNGFFCPKFKVLTKKSGQVSVNNIPFPFVVKPVDSSDSKGVSLVEKNEDLPQAISEAFSHSPSNKVILEEFIDSKYANFHGDGFVINGELSFCALGELLFTSKSNPLKPSCTLYPSRHPKQLILQTINEIKKAVSLSGYENGPVNIEARVNQQNEIVIMEIGPRSGGSLTPQAIFYSTGVDMLSATYNYMQGKPIDLTPKISKPSICFTVHTNSEGTLKKVEPGKSLTPFLVEKHIFLKKSDYIKSYKHTSSTVGVFLFSFNCMEEFNTIESDLYDELMKSVKLG